MLKKRSAAIQQPPGTGA